MNLPNGHAQSCDNHPRFRRGCPPCQRKGRNYQIRRNLLGTPTTAPADLTIARVREMRALGYSIPLLVVETGLSEPEVKRLSYGAFSWVQLRTFHAVERAHARLRSLPGPSARARLMAQKRGWTPPEPLPAPAEVDEDFIDEHAVDRALSGERVPLTRAELTEAWQRLEARGCYANEIAERLHVAERTVQRWREQGAATSRRTKAPRAS